MTQPVAALSHFGINVMDLKAAHARARAEGIEPPQPFAAPLDIEAPSVAIMAQTEAICRNRPGFSSRSEWRAAVSAKMGVAV